MRTAFVLTTIVLALVLGIIAGIAESRLRLTCEGQSREGNDVQGHVDEEREEEAQEEKVVGNAGPPASGLLC